MAKDNNGFTPTEQAILGILNDGNAHSAEELHQRCCGPSSVSALRMAISRLRKKIKPRGLEIPCVLENRRAFYQLFRRVADS